MKIAFTTQGEKWNSMMDPRFGRTQFLLLYDEEKDEFISVDNRETGNEAHGAGPITAQKLFDLHPDILITGNGPGGNAAAVLARANIIIYTGAGDMKVEEAYESYKNNKLPKLP